MGYRILQIHTSRYLHDLKRTRTEFGTYSLEMVPFETDDRLEAEIMVLKLEDSFLIEVDGAFCISNFKSMDSYTRDTSQFEIVEVNDE